MRPRPKSQKRSMTANPIARDLGVKFSDDLQSLIQRSLDVMAFELTPNEAVSIILTALAADGLRLEECLHCKPGAFLEIARAAEVAINEFRALERQAAFEADAEETGSKYADGSP